MDNSGQKTSEVPQATDEAQTSQASVVGETTLPQEPQISPANTGSIPGVPVNPPESQVSPASVTTTIESKKGSRGFGVFVIIGVILILCIYGYVGYLYLQNQRLKSNSQEGASTSNSETEVTPTPEFNKDFIKVSEGNIVYDDGASGAKVIVDKANYNGTGITGFIKVGVSPDNAKICFEAWPPAPSPALYLAKADGSEVIQVNVKRQNCLWTQDSQKLLYVDIPSPGTYSNVYLYDVTSKEETNLTANADTQVSRNYGLVGFSADGTKAICKYEDSSNEEAGQCEIDLTSLEVTFL